MTDIAEPSIDVPVDVRGITRAKAPEPDLTGATITGDRYWSVEFAQREAEAMWPRVW